MTWLKMFYWFYVYDLTAQHVRPQSITKSQINISFYLSFIIENVCFFFVFYPTNNGFISILYKIYYLQTSLSYIFKL